MGLHMTILLFGPTKIKGFYPCLILKFSKSLRVAGGGPVNLIKILKLFRSNPIKPDHDYSMGLYMTILLFGPTKIKGFFIIIFI